MNYKEVIEKMDLQKDKKTMLLVNGLAVVIFVVMSVIMNIICPLPEWFMSPDRGSDIGNLLIISLATSPTSFSMNSPMVRP